VRAQQQAVAREALREQDRKLRKRAEPLEPEGLERLPAPQALRCESA